MNKILLVIRREYLTRVKKPSFWVLTIVVPILIALLYAIPIVLSSRSLEHSNVLIVDDSGIFVHSFNNTDNITYYDAGSLAYAKRQMEENDTIDAVVYIPARASTIPTDAFLYYYSDAPSMTVQNDVDHQLQTILRNNILLDVHGISAEDYAMLTGTKIKLRAKDIETGRDGFLGVKTAVGVVLSLLIFMAVFMFGSQVMRGVMEEKTNRIVEVIVCSVKPFQLMMGKVVGIGLVGVTQFLLWLCLSGIALGGITMANADLFNQAEEQQNMTEIATKGRDATVQMESLQDEERVSEEMQGLTAINFPLLIGMFLFYFVFGYLLYGSLFAAAGSLVDSETDSQQFSLPMTIPLILTILLMPSMLNEPSGSLAVWLSMIPFTSPVAMMFRIPFGVPVWQVVVSVLLLLVTFPLCIALAGKIYRTGILYYGKKINLRTLVALLHQK